MEDNAALNQAWLEIAGQGQELVRGLFTGKRKIRTIYPAYDYNNYDTIALPVHDIQTETLVNIVKFNLINSEISFVDTNVSISRHAICHDFIPNRPSLIVHGIMPYLSFYNLIHRARRFKTRGAYLYNRDYNLVCLPRSDFLPTFLERYQPIVVYGAGSTWIHNFRRYYPHALGAATGDAYSAHRNHLVSLHRRLRKARNKAACAWFDDHFRIRPLYVRRRRARSDMDYVLAKSYLPTREEIIAYVSAKLLPNEPQLYKEVLRLIRKIPGKRVDIDQNTTHRGIPVEYRLDKLT